MRRFFEPSAVHELLRDAWAGAMAALLRAGRPDVPSPPEFPAETETAYAVHDRTFPTLERCASATVAAQQVLMFEAGVTRTKRWCSSCSSGRSQCGPPAGQNQERCST